VKNLKDFIIPFKGLSLDTHEYQWDVDSKFFDFFAEQDFLDCELHISLKLDKKERMMELEFIITGSIDVECDRCLGQLTMPVNTTEWYCIKFGTEHIEESENVLIIPESEYQIDVATLIYEFLVLTMPIKKVHAEDENGNSLCNHETIQRLNSEKIDKEADPRWDALKNIKLD